MALRNLIDFSSWQGLLSTLLGLILVTIVAVGIRLVVMQRVQQRRERQNRQINERLKTLIAAYKTLGGSFTGNLAVDPSHLRDLRMRATAAPANPQGESAPEWHSSERRRRIRDAVEAALSDVMLLGTAEQVRLAAQAANDMVAGRQIETAQLVLSLRDFIREVLDLEVVPADLAIPKQGPVRSPSAGARGNPAGTGGRAGGRGAGQGGTGMAAGGLLGLGAGHPSADADALPPSGEHGPRAAQRSQPQMRYGVCATCQIGPRLPFSRPAFARVARTGTCLSFSRPAGSWSVAMLHSRCHRRREKSLPVTTDDHAGSSRADRAPRSVGTDGSHGHETAPRGRGLRWVDARGSSIRRIRRPPTADVTCAARTVDPSCPAGAMPCALRAT